METFLYSNRWAGPLPGKVLLFCVMSAALVMFFCLHVLILPLPGKREQW